MATYVSQMPTSYLTKDECDPCACPPCAGLECLCRPRYFAGQLLTDQTLTELDRYIVEKNKLHNRYLHGWGVVCGLEVVCAPCDKVTVRAGYALSPCGEDIIVCKDVTVPVCELIQKCKDKERREQECEPYPPAADPQCVNREEEWVLAIVYNEKSSRGITALKAGSGCACCSSCSCGGSGSCGCGCGCGGKQNGNGKSAQYAQAGVATTTARKYEYRPAQEMIAAQCEPTLTCEGYLFEVYKYVRKTTDAVRYGKFAPKGTEGQIVERVMKCLAVRAATLPPEPGPNASVSELHQWCCSLKAALQNNLIQYPVYDCELANALANFPCPDPNAPQFANDEAAYRAAIQEVRDNVSVIGGEYLIYCFCSAFLPPCPEVCDPRVPLATVTVRKDERGTCRIVRVCNIGVRKFVTSFVSLGYWFSFLTPLLLKFRQALEYLCCRLRLGNLASSMRFADSRAADATAGAASSTSGPRISSTFVSPNKPQTAPKITNQRGFKAFAGQVWANRGRQITGQTMFLGAIDARDENGQPYLATTELANPFYTVMVNNLFGPPLARLPDESLGYLRYGGTLFSRKSVAVKADVGAPADATAAETRTEADIYDLKQRVSELQAVAERQNEMIEELRQRLSGKK